MATVYLTPDKIKVQVPPGMNLRQVANMTGTSMKFGCRVGDCGTCIAKIDKGMELLSTVNPKETALFEMLEKKDNNLRLMCQCVIDSHEGEIVISYDHL